jgi:hypothetical protein
VFPQCRRSDLFRIKTAQVHLEKAKLPDVFLSKSNSVLTGMHCSRYASFKVRCCACERHMCFFNSAGYVYLEQREPLSTFKT